MPKNTVFLDTNCLLRYVLNDLPEQAAVVEDMIARGAAIDDAALLEFVWVLESFYEMSRRQVADKLQVFLLDPRITASSSLQTVAENYLTHSKISFLDSYLAVHAAQAGGRLYSFDKALVKSLPELVIEVV